MRTHTTATEVAEYLVWLAAHECEDDLDFLTPLKLQKLLYFVQGWSFAESGAPFFAERIEAWRDGPVVPEVYQRYKGREKLPIIPDKAAIPGGLSDRERALIHSVWNAYKRHSGWTLRDMTHSEQPYVDTYRPDDDAKLCSRVIDADRIKRAFRDRADAAVSRLGSHRDKLRRFAAENARKLTGRDSL